jgi:hypothetical protein
MVRLLSCAGLSIGSVPGSRCWMWKPCPRVGYHKCRSVWGWFCTEVGCCWMRAVIFVQATSNSWWAVCPGCFHLVKMWRCQVSFLSRCNPRYLTWSSQGGCTLFIWTGGHVLLRVLNAMWTDLRALDCILHLWSQIWIARWVSSFWEATAGSLSVARTTVSSANVAMVVGEIGKSAVYMRYSNGSRTLPWGTPAGSRQGVLLRGNFD